MPQSSFLRNAVLTAVFALGILLPFRFQVSNLSVLHSGTQALRHSGTFFSSSVFADEEKNPGLLFYLSGDKGFTADYAAGGDPEPNFLRDVKIIPNGAKGPGFQCENTQLMSYWAPGNIYAERGTLAFFWRSRDPVGKVQFPVFRVGYADAEVMEKEFGNTFSASAIADLNRYEVVVKLLEDGANREPFRARMLPPLENRIGRKEKLIARSRQRFAVRRPVIEAKLNRLMGDSR